MVKLSVFLLIWFFSITDAAASDWPVFGHDAARTGASPDRVLAPNNVEHLSVRWQIQLPAVADASPIFAATRLFITSRDGTTYAVDSASGRLVWHFPTHGPNITTSVPAFDPESQTLFVGGVDGFVHKLNPATGQEARGRGFPARITMAPQTEKNASSLNIANGYLYAQTSGYFGDATPYVGHVVAIRLRDGHAQVFNTLCSSRHELIDPRTCDNQRSGMWSRAGVVVDPDPSMHGRLYVATGNGPFDKTSGAFGDSVLSLSADAGKLVDYFTPDNYADLESEDLDLGSSSPAVLPRQSGSRTPLLAVQGGKDGKLRLFDRNHLGGLGQPLQTINLGYPLFCAPAVWSDAKGTVFVIIDIEDGVHAFKLGLENGKSRLLEVWHVGVARAYEGTSPIVSNGVVFVASSGSIVALDAHTGGRLWDHPIGQMHWQSPIVVNGAVFIADDDGRLTAFELSASRQP
jgi:hypothetical protein